MNKTPFILVYDSGIGGLTTLYSIHKLLPNQNYIYFADTKNCPYGSKCKTLLQNIILKNIKQLINQYNISHIVLACNTATTSAISFLRENISIPIIGTEPNVNKPSKLGFQRIVVLATPVTVNEEKLLNIENKLPQCIVNIGISKLAKCIEDYYIRGKTENLKIAKDIIQSKLTNFNFNDAIVLGCTHYVYLKNFVQSLGFTCFDGNDGVARQVKQIISNTSRANINQLEKSHSKGCIIFKTGTINSNLKYKKTLKNYENLMKITPI